MSSPCARRHVSSEEFNSYYFGDPDVKAVTKHFLGKYRGKVPDDELESCGMTGLWKALQYHRPGFGQKLTTSLVRFLRYECQEAVRQGPGGKREGSRSKYRPSRRPLEDYAETSWEEGVLAREEVEHVRVSIGRLPRRWMRKLASQRFLDGMTHAQIGRANGYGKTKSGRLLKLVAAELRRCMGV